LFDYKLFLGGIGATIGLLLFTYTSTASEVKIIKGIKDQIEIKS
jgi:hypothetical protein